MSLFRRTVLSLLATVGAVLVVTGCGSSAAPSAAAPDTPGTAESGSPAAASGGSDFPDVVKVNVQVTAERVYSFDVTMTSPYDTAEHYADGWRVKGTDGTVYGEMTLGHDHADEQPFTRTQTDVKIPEGVTSVVVEGRDIDSGYGGATVTVDLPST